MCSIASQEIPYIRDNFLVENHRTLELGSVWDGRNVRDLRWCNHLIYTLELGVPFSHPFRERSSHWSWRKESCAQEPPEQNSTLIEGHANSRWLHRKRTRVIDIPYFTPPSISKLLLGTQGWGGPPMSSGRREGGEKGRVNGDVQHRTHACLLHQYAQCEGQSFCHTNKWIINKVNVPSMCLIPL